jgi:oligopeptide transport system substrate-binding protein
VRTGRAFPLVVAVALALTACTTSAPEEPVASPTPTEPAAEEPAPDRQGGTLRVALALDPGSIDPRFVVDEEGELVVGAVFEPLVTLDDRLRVVPAAAEAWEVEDDGRTFEFTLREATFHDGSPVTAADFERSFTRIADGTADPPSFLAYLLEPVTGAATTQAEGGALEGVEAVDDRTLRITLTDPQPAFLRTLTHPSLVPVPPFADDDPEAFAQQPVGNGPFAMAEPREPDAFLRLARNADHHTPPLLDEVLLQVYPDDPGSDRQWEDLTDGQLQVADLAPERVEEARETYGSSPDGYRGPGVLDGVTSTVYLYGFDTTRPPFDDPAVRRAISLSIDRDRLADEVLQGTRVPATSIVPPPIPGAAGDACEHCRHDPDAARAELDPSAAEEPDDPDAEGEDPDDGADTDEPASDDVDAAGEPVTLEALALAHNRGRTHAEIAEAMAADLEDALDVTVELQAEDLQAFVLGVRRGDFPLFRLGWEAGEPDPGAYLYPLFHSSQIGLDNLTRYADEEVDALLDLARASEDDREAAEAYAEAERLILEDAPVIPLLWYRHAKVVAPEVRDLRWSPLGRVDLAAVWLDTA